MKKHHLADVLSLLEILCGALIIIFIFDQRIPIHSGHIFVIFSVGQLFDAFDGIAARRWPYPQDNKRRWWRENIEIIEYLKDIFLAFSALLFIVKRVDFTSGIIIVILSTAIGLICQIKIIHSPPKIAAQIALTRRNYGYLPGLATIILLLLWQSPWQIFIKASITMLTSISAVYLWYKKENRRTEHHTRLKE